MSAATLRSGSSRDGGVSGPLIGGTGAAAVATLPVEVEAMARRTIVITGASDGIGAAAARRISHGGDNVVLVGRSESKTAAVAAELDADHFVADFADLSQVRALADKIRSAYPRIDVLGNITAGSGNVTLHGQSTACNGILFAGGLLSSDGTVLIDGLTSG